MGNLTFDASTVKPNDAFDPLPPGWYTMRITGAEMVPSDKAGSMLKLEHEIDENVHPQHANRKVFSNLCLNHPTSQQAREIAQRTLSAICHAIGKLQITDTDQLLGQSLKVKLKVQPARADESGKQYDARNEVSGYKALSEATDAPPATASAGAGAVATGTAGAQQRPAKPSWK